jgi:hypothetical protein
MRSEDDWIDLVLIAVFILVLALIIGYVVYLLVL